VTFTILQYSLRASRSGSGASVSPRVAPRRRVRMLECQDNTAQQAQKIALHLQGTDTHGTRELRKVLHSATSCRVSMCSLQFSAQKVAVPKGQIVRSASLVFVRLGRLVARTAMRLHSRKITLLTCEFLPSP
jgi:hypothetical protein